MKSPRDIFPTMKTSTPTMKTSMNGPLKTPRGWASSALLFLAAALTSTVTMAQASSASQAPDGAMVESAAVHFALAKLLADEGKFVEAQERFANAVVADPEDAILRIEYSEFLFRFRRAAEAREQIAEAKRLAPDEPAALRIFGQIYLSSENPSNRDIAAAVESLEALRLADPSDLMGMVTLAQAYEGSRRVGDAADVIGELVGHHTANDRLKRYWVDLLTRAGRSKEATEVLREIVRLEQESIESRLELADREAAEGNFSAAIGLLEQLREIKGESTDEGVIRRLAQAHLARSQSPGLTDSQRQADLESAESLAGSLGEAEGLALRARVLGLSDQGDAAIDLLLTGPAETADDVANQVLLAQLLERENRLDEAEAAYERAVDLMPKNERLPVQVQRIRFLARAGRWSQVATQAEAVIGNSGPEEYPGLRALRLEALVKLGRHSQALKLLRVEGGKQPRPENLMSRAEVLAAQGNRKDALKELERVASDDPGLEQRRAEVLISLGDVEGAAAVVDRLMGDPSFETRISAGQFFSRDGLFAVAQRYFEQALASPEASADDNRRADAEFFLAQALERQGQFDEAAGLFRSVLKVRGDDPLALNYLGYMLADAGQDIEEALELIQRAVAIDPRSGAYQDSLGWAQYRLGDYEAAAESLERAVKLSPGNPTIFDHLGDAYRALDRIDEALSAYERAAAFAEDDEAAAVREKIRSLAGSLGSQ